eukprot:CAMPEP_0117444240 /NCGR_PEP_ID=MMETSP0759-20121206/5131_1 /TAXON_ID=63605 /ORGANISM="Percolomonas cosmopolitus, Strain WS" /LENGTH=282 /DNA_ID=CAMNT_0005236285 /DNA_START=21 /DNA_END=869 /DNA_ORIENTATION=-
MSYPNHQPPNHPRPLTNQRLEVNHHPLNEKQRRNLFLQHGTAGIAAFTLGRLLVMVPAQNYKNAAILSGNADGEPKNLFEGQTTEVARVLTEYTLKNVADRALINYTSLSVRAQEPIARFATSMLVAPLQVARVREARGEKTSLLNTFKETFTFERLFFLALHETLSSVLADFIASRGIFDYKGYYGVHYEANVRLSQLASAVLLTPLEVFAKRVAASESIGDLWQREYERIQDEAQDAGGFLKYLGGVTLWNIPEAIGMVVEKIVYRKIVDNWPVKQVDLE